MAYATDSSRVAQHSFYPFMLYTQRWTRFAEKGKKGKEKKRPIRYAARLDAYIFSRYRHELSARYEAELRRLNISNCVLAYRRLADAATGRGKCNIHFARDAMQEIARIGDCCAITLDISGFFESLDHSKLRELWTRLLGVNILPEDHHQVFKAITRYSVVEQQKAYERLGLFGIKRHTKSGRPIKGYLKPRNQIPPQLCTGKDFQHLIGGKGALKTIIKQNKKPYGIPQGAPISDLLANIYLLDFDVQVAAMVRPLGGTYFRYSDDILLIVPGDKAVGLQIERQVRLLITQHGQKLKIKDDKSSIVAYSRGANSLSYELVLGKQGKNGLEYLGFRYNGEFAYIRDSTLSGLGRKIVYAARREANALARRYPDKQGPALKKLFDYEKLIQRFGRVEDFKELSPDVRSWTFWTYVRRASDVLGVLGKPIRGQLKRHRHLVRQRADEEIERAVRARERR